MDGQDISSEMLTLSLLSIMLVLSVRGDPVCTPGTYGDTCDKNCSERCRVYSVTNRVYCDKTSGSCFEGCIPGWYADTCNRECSKNCVNNTCNQQAGECTHGCTDGKKGTFCELQVTTEEGHAVKTQENTTGRWAGLASGVVGVALVVIVTMIILLVTWFKRRKLNSGARETLIKGLQEVSVMDKAIHQAILCGDLDHLKQLVDDGETDVNRRGLNGMTPLMLAAVTGRHDVFEHLHHQGADMTLTTRDGEHILILACCGGNVDIAKYVISVEPDFINRKRNDGSTSLMWAAGHGKRIIFEYLLDKGADYMSVDNYGENILHYAFLGRHIGIVKMVIANTAIDINSRNRYGKTALFFAARGGHRDVFDLLVGKGANVSLLDNKGNNILHMACMEGHVGMVQHILSQQMVDINSRGQCGRTPLLWAAWWNHNAVIRLLVSLGADLVQVDDGGNNILHIVCETGNEDIVRLVLSKKRLDINERNRHGETASMLAKGEIYELLMAH